MISLPAYISKKASATQPTFSKEYKLEYGDAEIHIQKLLTEGKVVIIDD